MLKMLLLTVVSLVLFNCAGLQMSLKNSSAQKPSNVALYFTVETNDNFPVPNIPAEAFKIYEDGKLISPYESKQTILNPEISVVHYTMLLLDLSGSITESGTLPNLIQAATLFAEKVSKNQNVAVFGFDGGEKLIPIVAPTTDMGAVKKGLSRLESYEVKDPSTNLNGAVVEAVSLLKSYVAKSNQPLRFSTLVIFTDGTDRASRVSEEAMYNALEKSESTVFAIGVGGELSVSQLKKMSNAGYKQATDLTQISDAFNEVAAIIEAASKKFYLLSYCSPSRAGMHSLKVEVLSNDLSGSISHEFDATGFGPGCDPNKKPNFKTGAVTMGQTKISPNETAKSINQ